MQKFMPISFDSHLIIKMIAKLYFLWVKVSLTIVRSAVLGFANIVRPDYIKLILSAYLYVLRDVLP